MPILWNGNFIREWSDPDEAWYARAEAYARAFIARFQYEPFILMWGCDQRAVMYTDYARSCGTVIRKGA